MKFIHAADIHLDSPLTGLSAYDDAPVALLRTATRAAFSNLVSEAIDGQVDFLVIAGDLYDGAWKDHNTGIFFCKEMGRLKKAGIPTYLLFGNHDAESEMTKKLEMPDNVFVFDSKKPKTFTLEKLKVKLHGRSFKDAATTENLVTTYPAPIPGFFNIGVLHTALEGNTVHANYAPCSLDELHAKGYNYWALGHVHEHKVWTGTSTVVFPGNLQGRHIRETGPRGAVLVSVDSANSIQVERLLVDVLRWQLLEIDVSSCQNLAGIIQVARSALDDVALNAPNGIPLAIRISITGKTAAHGDLFGLESQLRAEIVGLVAAIAPDRIWVEKVKISTMPIDDDAIIRERADAISDLYELLLAAETDPDFIKNLQEELLPLVTKAPIDLQEAVPYFKEIRSGNLANLVRETRLGLIANLSKGS